MGFGHRIYKKDDPRSSIIKQYSIALSKTKYGKPTVVAISQNIEKRMIEEKKIYPNLDFYSASAYNQCGVHTYILRYIAISSRLFSLSLGHRAGLRISSSNENRRRL
jgi:2-methylcitrate synthase